MRFIDQEKLKPKIRHLLADLQEAHDAVVAENDPGRRAALIEKYRPRWVAFRDAFDEFSGGKCWYVECKNPGTDNDVDHFRPKSGVAEDATHPGYYWLAFDWTNYRYSCHRANRLRRNPESGQTGGKADHFPLVMPTVYARSPSDVLSAETPALLDPTNPADTLLLSFKPNGEIDLVPERKGDVIAEAKIDASRLYLHLDWPKFRDARLVLYNKIERTVDRGNREAPNDVSGFHRATDSFKDAIRDLLNTIDAREEYSVAAYSYVASFKHVWWIRDIVLKIPA